MKEYAIMLNIATKGGESMYRSKIEELKNWKESQLESL